ncbi:MAG: GCN5-related N-acetyltransferase [Candidatus Kaiserbacteria bacterium GW2011_GWA2_49_19]|uniref:GCN5-related N-acetyltransferase n=2 Tax=Candidatus Kaiseribacteriota TaxID=1752734 RepID=A0A0G1VSW0_9BACT|nr:MAG: GCN5-related N-acetyltransferase [Candidatus Kaiserbacteria bacterium GW2011_GWA2_49_19]OGG60710.1 MAG: hypothetical protein A3C86_01665 [Candidatus Kaiserbacteria bacterium RIFCSPHIGHO2_02_FULL_49_16]
MTDERSTEFVLRRATIEDAECLFNWRNDPETRKHSKNNGIINWDEHLAWLLKSVGNYARGRMLYIAETIDGRPVGTVRADICKDDSYEISYTVAPEFRGKGVAKRMVVQFVREIIPQKSLVAHIQKGHASSEGVAKALGLHPVSENPLQDGVVMTEWR